MAQPEPDLPIVSMRGGMNDTDPAPALAIDQCVLAQNIEFFWSMLGERRNGCGPLDITNSDLEDETTIVHISQWFPTNNVIDPEFIAISATPGVSATIAKRTAGVWSEIVPVDAINTTSPGIYEITTQALNAKLYIPYRSSVDRLHLWDGTALRRVGLPMPVAAPTAVNEGVGVYASIRYFRDRFITKSGSTIVNRSEPSDAVTFTPSGAGAGATITRSALPGETETHWELEASTDGSDFYLIQTIAIATTTYNDETAYATGYAGQGPLSEDIGSYDLLPSSKFVAVDGDRLILAGHQTDITRQSQVLWTPVTNDPGVGNNERLPLTIDNTVSLDNSVGGPITGLIMSTIGTGYVFKWDHIYKVNRTGDVNRAYDIFAISESQGAIPGSVVRGLDESGNSCIYFLDPSVGPSRIGGGGIQKIVGLRKTWARVNLQASKIVSRGVYYPYKQQVHWWIAVDGADVPNFKIVVQVSELTPMDSFSVGRGLSIATGRITEATAVGVLTEVVTISGTNYISERPFVGMTSPDYLQRCDTESTDAGVAYTATLRTRPYMQAGLLGRWGVMAATLLAAANASLSLVIKLIRDFGVENSASLTTTLTATGSELIVIKDFDNLLMSGARSIQVEFTDP